MTYTLALIYESDNKIDEASNLMQELQIETFGSMEKREKVHLMLEQMRFTLARNDLIKTMIISKKIHVKFFADEAMQDLKLKYYNLIIDLDRHHRTFSMLEWRVWSLFKASVISLLVQVFAVHRLVDNGLYIETETLQDGEVTKYLRWLNITAIKTSFLDYRLVKVCCRLLAQMAM